MLKETLESIYVFKATKSQIVERSMPRLSEANMPPQHPSMIMAGTSEETKEPNSGNPNKTETETFEVFKSK